MVTVVEEKRFKEQMQRRVEAVEAILREYLPQEEGYQKTVLEAMNYSVLAGGKRLRPMLMQEMYRLFGGKSKMIEPFMAAIEMIHTYSLVHDDLPAMDNDEYRRGRKTTHVVYGEAMAILAGDGLLNYAFETALKAYDMVPEGEEQRPEIYQAIGKALRILAAKAGVYGMIGGQTADIEAEKKDRLTREQLLFIHEKKTAALIQASMMAGAVLAGAGEEELIAVEKCAYDIGIAFQIQDDILDVVGDSALLGKPTGSDEKNHKQTYVTLNGLERSKEEVRRLSGEAAEILTRLEEERRPGDSEGSSSDREYLRQLVMMLVDRRN